MRRCREAFGLLLTTLPALAVTVQVAAPVQILGAREQVTLTAQVTDAPSQNVRWHCPQAPGAINHFGEFTAPVTEQDVTYTVQAESVHDERAVGEARLLVRGTRGRGALPRGAQAAAGRYVPGRLPFYDEPWTCWGHEQLPPWKDWVAGYGLPVPFQPFHSSVAEGRLLTLGEGQDRVRFGGAGVQAPVVTLTGWTRHAHMETLYRDGDGHLVRKVKDGVLQVRGLVPFAGPTGAEAGDEDGVGPAARFREPWGMAKLASFDNPAGQVAVADRAAHVLRAVDRGGAVTTLAGKAQEPGFRDGKGAEARFDRPTHLAARTPNPNRWTCAPVPEVWVADSGNHAIRAMNTGHGVWTHAGTGQRGFVDNCDRSEARFDHPEGLASTYEGSVYVADAGNFRIRRIDYENGFVTTLAGSGVDGTADGRGAAASFHDLKGMATDGTLLYVLDGHSLRRIDPRDGTVATLLGQADRAGFLPRLDAQDDRRLPCLNDPTALAFTPEGLFIADTGNHAVRLFRPAAPAGEAPLLTVAGDPLNPATRPGLLLDGQPLCPGPDYAALGAPRGLAAGGTSVFAATGRGVVALSSCLRPAPHEGLRMMRPAALGAGDRVDHVSAPPIAGRTYRLKADFHPSFSGLQVPEPFTWTLTFLDPATRQPILEEPLRGAGTSAAGALGFLAGLPRATPLLASFRAVTNQGLTGHFTTLVQPDPEAPPPAAPAPPRSRCDAIWSWVGGWLP